MTRSVFIDSFDSTGHLEGAERTYENIKEAALEQGRFSAFEASSSMTNAAMFTRLSKDPEVEIFDIGYPWHGIRRREK